MSYGLSQGDAVQLPLTELPFGRRRSVVRPHCDVSEVLPTGTEHDWPTMIIPKPESVGSVKTLRWLVVHVVHHE
jgi:hypothetical protein